MDLIHIIIDLYGISQCPEVHIKNLDPVIFKHGDNSCGSSHINI